MNIEAKYRLRDIQLYKTENGFIPFIYNITKTKVLLVFGKKIVDILQEETIDQTLERATRASGNVEKNPYSAYFKFYYSNKLKEQIISDFSDGGVFERYNEITLSYGALRKYISTLNRQLKKSKEPKLGEALIMEREIKKEQEAKYGAKETRDF